MPQPRVHHDGILYGLRRIIFDQQGSCIKHRIFGKTEVIPSWRRNRWTLNRSKSCVKDQEIRLETDMVMDKFTLAALLEWPAHSISSKAKSAESPKWQVIYLAATVIEYLRFLACRTTAPGNLPRTAGFAAANGVLLRCGRGKVLYHKQARKAWHLRDVSPFQHMPHSHTRCAGLASHQALSRYAMFPASRFWPAMRFHGVKGWRKSCQTPAHRFLAAKAVYNVFCFVIYCIIIHWTERPRVRINTAKPLLNHNSLITNTIIVDSGTHVRAANTDTSFSTTDHGVEKESQMIDSGGVLTPSFITVQRR